MSEKEPEPVPVKGDDEPTDPDRKPGPNADAKVRCWPCDANGKSAGRRTNTGTCCDKDTRRGTSNQRRGG